MEKTSLETEPNELLEQIKRKLKSEWHDAMPSDIPSEERTEIIEKEFEKLLEIYEEQKRPIESLTNLLAGLESCKTNLEKLALFYKDTSYNPKVNSEENNQGSFGLAENFTNTMLPEIDREKFKKIMTGEN